MEENELDAFEELEEAAENVSLSSNSSLVMKFLGKKSKQDKLKGTFNLVNIIIFVSTCIRCFFIYSRFLYLFLPLKLN